ncbi:putative reverse transcriptase domain-containing protein, partial [Tanacetum coccineum]
KHGLSYASKPNPRTEPRAESRPCYNRNGGNGNGGNNGYSYKTFTSCNPKEFDGKGGAVALTRWIANMESVFDNCGCTANQRVKYVASCFVNKALTCWNTQVQARGHEEAIGMSWNDFRALLIEEFCPSNEMEKLENEFWNLTMVGANHVAYNDKFHELAKLVPHMGNDKRKEMEESSKQGSTWKDNKKAKTGSRFMATVPPRNDNESTYPKCARCYTFHPENASCRLCYNCQKLGHLVKQCWAPIRQVAHVNEVRMGPNQRAYYECGSLDYFRNNCPKWNQATGPERNPLALEGSRNTRNNGNQARGRAFNGNAFAPLLNVEPCTINPGYVIEIADGHGSFHVIVGMDWLSKNEAVIVCHEKVVEIPIKEGRILRVHGERTLGAAKALMNAKMDEPRISDILVVRDFTDVFPKDLLGLPPQ